MQGSMAGSQSRGPKGPAARAACNVRPPQPGSTHLVEALLLLLMMLPCRIVLTQSACQQGKGAENGQMGAGYPGRRVLPPCAMQRC